MINNNGTIVPFPDDSDDNCKERLQKAECLVHYTYQSSSKKLMLLDIQGMDYKLFDPEIATTQVMDEDNHEVFFVVVIVPLLVLMLSSHATSATSSAQ